MKYGSVGIALAAFCVGAAMMSCKPGRSEQRPNGLPAAQKSSEASKGKGKDKKVIDQEFAVSDLRVGFVLSDSESTLPEPGRSSSPDLLEGATQAGHLLQLKKRLTIPRPGSLPNSSKERLFLVFPDSIGGRRVVDASYEHRIFSSSGDTRINLQRTLVSRDRDRSLYFIPLDALKDAKGEGLSSLDLQILELELRLDDGSGAHFEIRFYVKGDLPSVELVRQSQVVADPGSFQKVRPPGTSVQKWAMSEGWTVLTERYVNPLSRPLALWFSARDVSFQLLTQLGLKFDRSEVGPFMLKDERGISIGYRQFSLAPLVAVNLVVRDPSKGKPKTFSLRGDSSVPVRIDPGQTLEVEWRALAPEKPIFCQAGEAGSGKFRACARSQKEDDFVIKAVDIADCDMPIGFGVSYYLNPMNLNGNWQVQSYSVTGRFENHVVLTEEIGAQDRSLQDAVQAGLARVFPSAPFAADSAAKPGSSLSPLYSCQGIF